MNLSLFIARRYLFSRKSHNVINIISAISAAGMAIGTAAMVIIMSVYNGFDDLVKSMMKGIEPDLMISPAEGKVFVPQGETYDWIYDQECVLNMCTVLQEQVFLNYGGHQGVALAKGVDEIYQNESPLVDNIREGAFSFHKGDVPMAVVGTGLASSMDISPRFLTGIELYFPSRTRKISLSNPASSIEHVKVWPSGIFSVNADIDASTLLVPIETMSELLEYENGEVSSVEIRLVEGTSAKQLHELAEEISKRLGPDFLVRDRYQQNVSLYKMMRYEKAAIFLILIFVVIIIAFNVFGSLSMLIIEKKGDIETLSCMGATDSLIKRIFVLEGWMISLLGLVIGLLVGLLVTWLQQRFGLIRMPGNFVVSAYPVRLVWSDVLGAVSSVALIGYLVALIPVISFYRRKSRQQSPE